MKAIFHRYAGEEEKVEVKDIFVDDDGEPKMLFVGKDGKTDVALINRFTDCVSVWRGSSDYVI
jgi:hypothetical protein